MRTIVCAALLAACAALPARAAEGTYQVTMLTPEAALKAAQAALATCRDSGWQAAVAIVDRGGNVQVLLRDRFAGPHTPDTAIGKAWSAVSFRTDTSDLVDLTQAGKPQSGMRHIPGAMVIGGGMRIESEGSIIAGIGVSGAPGGEADDKCAKAGIKAIQDLLAF